VLSTLTKNSAERATGAHVSIIGHITRDELQFARAELGGGFANRFLFCCARRSKKLPSGGQVQTVDFAPVVAQLQQALAFARDGAEMRRDADADTRWCDEYVRFPEPDGTLGNVTTRGEAHVLRLAVLYAVADQSSVVRLEHLEAALEVWRYCFESARHLFGDTTGSPLADQLYEQLPEHPMWMTRTEIRDAFGRHRESKDIDSALAQLQARGLATTETDRTGAGRPTERWSRLPDPAGAPATKATKATKPPANGLMSLMSHMSQSETDGDLPGWREI
jgi:hypothetical protein